MRGPRSLREILVAATRRRPRFDRKPFFAPSGIRPSECVPASGKSRSELAQIGVAGTHEKLDGSSRSTAALAADDELAILVEGLRHHGDEFRVRLRLPRHGDVVGARNVSGFELRFRPHVDVGVALVEQALCFFRRNSRDL